MNMILENPLIQQAYIHGDHEKYITALFTLDQKQLADWGSLHGIKKGAGLVDHPLVFEEIKKHVQEVNSRLGAYESVKKFKILPKDFSVEDGTLTPSLKLKKKAIQSLYKDDIQALYH